MVPYRLAAGRVAHDRHGAVGWGADELPGCDELAGRWREPRVARPCALDAGDRGVTEQLLVYGAQVAEHDGAGRVLWAMADD
jgi:hypothetical protein